MASANLGTDAIDATTNNQHEFMNRKDDWVSKQGNSSAAPESVPNRLPYLLNLMAALLCFLLLNLLGARILQNEDSWKLRLR